MGIPEIKPGSGTGGGSAVVSSSVRPGSGEEYMKQTTGEQPAKAAKDTAPVPPCGAADGLIEFRKLSDFPRGTLYDMLVDAYSFDKRNRQIWDANWKETDDFFCNHPEIADKYALVTCLEGTFLSHRMPDLPD